MKRRYYSGFYNTNLSTVRTAPSPEAVQSMLMKYNSINTKLDRYRTASSSSPSPERFRLEQVYKRYKQQQSRSHNHNNNNKIDENVNPPIWSEYRFDRNESVRKALLHGSAAGNQFQRRDFFNRRPFVGSSVEDYTNRYWCVKFTFASLGHENREMQRYVSWYAVKCKVVYLDYLPFVGNKLKQDVQRRMKGSTELPALFVSGKCVGGLSTLRVLEESGRLKDVLQFGFLWHTRPDAGPEVSPQGLPVPPSFYGDEEMFRGQWRGAPVSAPVVELPKYLPRDSITYGRATGDKR